MLRELLDYLPQLTSVQARVGVREDGVDTVQEVPHEVGQCGDVGVVMYVKRFVYPHI